LAFSTFPVLFELQMLENSFPDPWMKMFTLCSLRGRLDNGVTSTVNAVMAV